MDFWKTVLVLLRRWYVAVPAFVVSIGAAAIMFSSVPVRYASSGTAVLTAPTAGASSQAAAERGETNPLLAFDSSLSITASIVIQSMNTPAVADQIGADKLNTFEISSGELGGPFIVVKTESASKETAKAMVNSVIERVRQELEARQNTLKAPPSTFIKLDPVVPATEPETLMGGKMRAAGAALALGLFASLGSAFALESFMQAKRRRTKKAADAEPEPTDEPVEAAAQRPTPSPILRAVEQTVIIPRLTGDLTAKQNGSAAPTKPRVAPVVEHKQKTNGVTNGKSQAGATNGRASRHPRPVSTRPEPAWPESPTDSS